MEKGNRWLQLFQDCWRQQSKLKTELVKAQGVRAASGTLRRGAPGTTVPTFWHWSCKHVAPHLACFLDAEDGRMVSTLLTGHLSILSAPLYH